MKSPGKPSMPTPSWLKVSPATKMKLAQLFDRARRAAGATVDIATAVNEMGVNPKLRNYVAAGSVALSKVLDATKFEPWAQPGFVWPCLGCEFLQSVSSILADHPTTRKIATEEHIYQVTELDDMIVVFDVGNDKAIWAASDGNLSPHEMLKRIGTEMWKALGMRVWVSFGDLTTGNLVKFAKWEPGKVHPSEMTDLVLERIGQFLDAGHHRALMLYGDPGVGKSSIVNAVADRMAVPTLVLEQRQLIGMSSGNLNDILEMLQPDVVIIDDFDRFGGGGFQIGTVDRIRKTAKLLLVTVNDFDRIDSAVVRAGRFDDVIRVDSVRAVHDIIPDLPERLVEEVQRWPIAFVDELRLRLDVLGPDRLHDEVALLRERVRLQRTKRDDDEPDDETGDQSPKKETV